MASRARADSYFMTLRFVIGAFCHISLLMWTIQPKHWIHRLLFRVPLLWMLLYCPVLSSALGFYTPEIWMIVINLCFVMFNSSVLHVVCWCLTVSQCICHPLIIPDGFINYCIPFFSSFFTWLSISRRFPLYEPGPAQGFSLLKGLFFLPLWLARGSGSGSWLKQKIYK